MKAVKIIGGVLLFIIGAFLALSALNNLLRFTVELHGSTSGSYLAGYSAFSVVLGTASFFIMRFGVRLTRKKV
jgi:hypothetical protein